MKILIDTREKNPLTFSHKLVSETIITTLNAGDYCAQWENGDLAHTVFERKTINDLYGTLSNGYERFRKEIKRVKEAQKQIIIVIEGTLESVCKGCGYSRRDPDSLVKQLFTLMVKHSVIFVCCGSRAEMSRYIVEYYAAHARMKVAKNKD